MNEQFDSFVEDLLAEKLERPLIIVGSSKIDDLLKSILTKYFLPKASREEDLLDGDRPLATFSARIKLCYRLGILNKDLFLVLEQLRSIRNKSAHGVEFNTKKQPIRDHLQNISRHLSGRQSLELTKKRYFGGQLISDINMLQCTLIALCVILQAIFESIEQTQGVDKTLKISNK